MRRKRPARKVFFILFKISPMIICSAMQARERRPSKEWGE